MLQRAAAAVYFGRWDTLVDGRVMAIDHQLRQHGRFVSATQLNAENFLADTLKFFNLSLRRYPLPAFLSCCAPPLRCFRSRCVPALLPGAPPGGFKTDSTLVPDATGAFALSALESATVIGGKYVLELQGAALVATLMALPRTEFVTVPDAAHSVSDCSGRTGCTAVGIRAPRAAAVLFESLIARVPWTVNAPELACATASSARCTYLFHPRRRHLSLNGTATEDSPTAAPSAATTSGCTLHPGCRLATCNRVTIACPHRLPPWNSSTHRHTHSCCHDGLNLTRTPSE